MKKQNYLWSIINHGNLFQKRCLHLANIMGIINNHLSCSVEMLLSVWTVCVCVCPCCAHIAPPALDDVISSMSTKTLTLCDQTSQKNKTMHMLQYWSNQITMSHKQGCKKKQKQCFCFCFLEQKNCFSWQWGRNKTETISNRKKQKQFLNSAGNSKNRNSLIFGVFGKKQNRNRNRNNFCFWLKETETISVFLRSNSNWF